MSLEATITIPWTEEKRRKLIESDTKSIMSDPIDLSRKTHTGAQEKLQFKVEVAVIPANNQCIVLLHCVKGQNVTVLWSYKDECSADEERVEDKVHFNWLGRHKNELGRIAYGGAMHKQIFHKSKLFDQFTHHYSNLEVHIKVQEEQARQILTKKKKVSGPEDIVKDLSNMLNSDDTADVYLISQGSKFPCHRALLAARSSVFKTMFFGKGDYAERKTGQVTLDEFKPQEVKQFLRFIYTGDCIFGGVVDPWQILALADMYDVQMLNKTCRQVLTVVMQALHRI